VIFKCVIIKKGIVQDHFFQLNRIKDIAIVQIHSAQLNKGINIPNANQKNVPLKNPNVSVRIAAVVPYANPSGVS